MVSTESEKVFSSEGLECIVKAAGIKKMRRGFCTNNFENQVSNPGSRSLMGMLDHCTTSVPEILVVISVYNL